MRCLEKDPAARWSSADELLNALNGIRITSSEIPAVARTERIPARQSGWRRGLLIGAAATFAVIAAIGAYRRWTPARGHAAPPAADSVRQVESPDSTPAAARVPSPPAPPAAPSVLTRADSEAIAASVAKRMNRQRPAAPGLSQGELDSIRNAVEQSVTDSVLRMIGPARRGTPGLPDAQTMVKIGDMAGLTELRIMGGRRAFRVAIPPLADATADQSLQRLAVAIAESLARAVRRQPLVRGFTGASGRSVAQRFETPHMPGEDGGADALVRGMVRPVGQDSVEAVFQLRDGGNPVVAKTLRHAVLKEEAALLPAAVTPMIAAWIESRERESRPARATGLSPEALDSMLRETQRLRESLRRKPTSRPDSLPPRPPG